MMAFEDAVRQANKDFSTLCQEVFGTPDGQRLLSVLCMAANPLEQTFTQDGRAAAHLAGNREVVATLWRYGATTPYIPGKQHD